MAAKTAVSAPPPDEGEAAAEKEAPAKVRVLAGGHVIEADPVPPTPAPLTRDSVTGQIVDPDAAADTAGGWGIQED